MDEIMDFLFINVNHKGSAFFSDTIPLSMGYILAYLRGLGHHGAILDDLLDRRLSLYALEMWIAKLRPAVIGFTAYQDNMETIRFFSRYVKLHHKNIRILLGGPQASFLPSTALRELRDVDLICRGEGERVTAAIAECLENNNRLSSVSGITFREGDEIIDTAPPPDLPEDLDQFPSPYLDNIIDLKGRDTALILTSRGCRYNCLFCISPTASSRKIRYHSVKRVLNEMEYLMQKGIRRLWFADPNFPSSSERDLEILQGKIARGIKMPFWCETRCDLVDEEILAKLREAGADTISFGLESANPGVLKSTGKGIALEHMRRMIEYAKSIGLNVELTSIFGLPGETFQKAYETLEFLRTHKVPIQTQQMQLYFGSMYEKNREKYGFKPIPGYLPAYLSVGLRYETQTLTRTDIRKLRNISYLAHEIVRQDVQNREHSFDVLDFLLRNEDDLRNEETFYEYGAIVSSTLEEEELLWRFLDGYVTRLSPNQSRVAELMSKINIYEETELGASATSRIILDCRIEANGVSFPGTNREYHGYQDVMLGRGVLPPSYEMHFLGVREGQEVAFEFNKAAKMWARVHKVFNPVRVISLDQLKALTIQNHYQLRDLDRLSREDDVLYHLALKAIPEDDLLKMRGHFLMHVYHYAKLHRIVDVERLAGLFEAASNREAFEEFADVLHSAGRYSEATYYYGQADSNRSSTLIKKANSLRSGGQAEKALEVMNSMPQSDSLSFQEVLLECLKVVQPSSERIPSLDRYLLDLKIEAAMDSEIVNRHTTIQPIVQRGPFPYYETTRDAWS